MGWGHAWTAFDRRLVDWIVHNDTRILGAYMIYIIILDDNCDKKSQQEAMILSLVNKTTGRLVKRHDVVSQREGKGKEIQGKGTND